MNLGQKFFCGLNRLEHGKKIDVERGAKLIIKGPREMSSVSISVGAMLVTGLSIQLFYSYSFDSSRNRAYKFSCESYNASHNSLN